MLTPTQKTVALFRSRLGVKLPANAQTLREQWGYLAGYQYGVTRQDDGWVNRTYAEVALWEQGEQAGIANREDAAQPLD